MPRGGDRTHQGAALLLNGAPHPDAHLLHQCRGQFHIHIRLAARDNCAQQQCGASRASPHPHWNASKIAVTRQAGIRNWNKQDTPVRLVPTISCTFSEVFTSHSPCSNFVLCPGCRAVARHDTMSSPLQVVGTAAPQRSQRALHPATEAAATSLHAAAAASHDEDGTAARHQQRLVSQQWEAQMVQRRESWRHREGGDVHREHRARARAFDALWRNVVQARRHRQVRTACAMGMLKTIC